MEGEDVPPCPDGQPDLRFVLANERTFLAWNRTALAFVAAGLAVAQLLGQVAVPGGNRTLALPLIGAGGVMATMSYRRWRQVGNALVHRKEPPRSVLPQILAVTVTATAMAAVVIAVTGP